jgi:hypothetical protein
METLDTLVPLLPQVMYAPGESISTQLRRPFGEELRASVETAMVAPAPTLAVHPAGIFVFVSKSTH